MHPKRGLAHVTGLVCGLGHEEAGFRIGLGNAVNTRKGSAVLGLKAAVLIQVPHDPGNAGDGVGGQGIHLNGVAFVHNDGRVRVGRNVGTDLRPGGVAFNGDYAAGEGSIGQGNLAG